jgi:hypothetical protein
LLEERPGAQPNPKKTAMPTSLGDGRAADRLKIPSNWRLCFSALEKIS